MPPSDADRRLFDVADAGKYADVSPWTVRDWVASGILPTVKLPGGRLRTQGAHRGRVIRKILIDRRDLDRLIEESKA